MVAVKISIFKDITQCSPIKVPDLSDEYIGFHRTTRIYVSEDIVLQDYKNPEDYFNCFI